MPCNTSLLSLHSFGTLFEEANTPYIPADTPYIPYL